jgi:GNAT superfamily N-acetyltransferase
MNTDAPFDAKIWTSIKQKFIETGSGVLKQKRFERLLQTFNVVPITADNREMLLLANNLIEKEFPKHGAPLHFLMSTLPFGGGYDPILKDNLFHNGLQYWLFTDKASSSCAASCGLFLMEKDHATTIWAGWLVLSPEFRGQGLGKMLMEFIIECSKEFGKKNGQKKLCFSTSDEPHVEKARLLYRQLGFQEISIFPNPYVPGSQVIIEEMTL